ncbi:MAG: HDIG domain-containing protein [Candidatus Woesearchaeota archaeon]|nr:HDIG domain-containing protein [Candidatus Woesearchaeota archaeon]
MRPTKEQCLKLLKEHNVPENVIKHSMAVNKVAVFLAKKLKEKGVKINISLVDRASLLHDLDKIPTLDKGNHGEVARKILEERGHHKLGEVVHKHIFEAPFKLGLNSWEEKIVNYADKRCTEDKIVPLKERFEYGRKRYGKESNEHREKTEKYFFDLEKQIFDIIGLEPEKLGEHIKVQ